MVFWCGVVNLVADKVCVCESVGCEVSSICFSLVLVERLRTSFLFVTVAHLGTLDSKVFLLFKAAAGRALLTSVKGTYPYHRNT